MRNWIVFGRSFPFSRRNWGKTRKPQVGQSVPQPRHKSEAHIPSSRPIPAGGVRPTGWETLFQNVWYFMFYHHKSVGFRTLHVVLPSALSRDLAGNARNCFADLSCPRYSLPIESFVAVWISFRQQTALTLAELAHHITADCQHFEACNSPKQHLSIWSLSHRKHTEPLLQK
jgi:hypothetical protein